MRKMIYIAGMVVILAAVFVVLQRARPNPFDEQLRLPPALETGAGVRGARKKTEQYDGRQPRKRDR